MTSPCAGPEFSTDATGSLRIKTPRPVPYPYPPSQMAASNGLMRDATGGLWVPQTPHRMGCQQFGASVTQAVAIGATYNPAASTLTAIANPSAVFSALFQAELEWLVGMTGGFGAVVELNGSYTVGSVSAALATVADTAIGTNPFSTGASAAWAATGNRTAQITLAPGATITPAMAWQFVNMSTSLSAVTVTAWRMVLSWSLVLQYPTSVV